MSEKNLSLFDGLQIAKEAELKAAQFYADGAAKTNNPLGKKLLQSLTEFEQYHFQKLTELENSLKEKGSFIKYTGRELNVSASSLIMDKHEADKVSALGILSIAMDLEVEAKDRYKALIELTTDPDGKAMFTRLAEEEGNHYRIVSDAYWNLSNRGVWEMPK